MLLVKLALLYDFHREFSFSLIRDASSALKVESRGTCKMFSPGASMSLMKSVAGL